MEGAVAGTTAPEIVHDALRRRANLGAGAHCTVLKGDVTPQKVAAARRHMRSYRDDFGDLPSMQKLATLLSNL